mgnify:CR=1 FL=1
MINTLKARIKLLTITEPIRQANINFTPSKNICFAYLIYTMPVWTNGDKLNHYFLLSALLGLIVNSDMNFIDEISIGALTHNSLEL